jgi:hypothetical protein
VSAINFTPAVTASITIFVSPAVKINR